MTVSLPVDRIFRRFDDLRSFIAPILSESDHFEVFRLPQIRDYTLGILPFGYSSEAVLDPANLRFPTKWEGIFFNYHERWVPYNGAKRFALERAYLHLYLNALDDLQAASLHCDPLMEKNESNYAFKRGPHLHIAGGTPDISRAHVSICASDSAKGGNNLGSLTSTLRSGVCLLVEEFIPAYTRHLESNST